MAMKSTSFYNMTNTGAKSKWSTQVVDIGDLRNVQVTAHEKGMRFANGELKPGRKPEDNIVNLDAGAVKMLARCFEDVRHAMSDCKVGELENEYFLPLGKRYFVQIKPDIKCLSIRKFFRPRHDPKLLYPGYPGVALKFKEFQNLESEWNELLETVPYQSATMCDFDDPKDHKDCQYCFF